MCSALSFEESQVEFPDRQHCLTSHDRLFFLVGLLPVLFCSLNPHMSSSLFVCFSLSIGLHTCSVPLVHVRADRESVETTVTECFIDTLNIDVFPYLCVVSHL